MKFMPTDYDPWEFYDEKLPDDEIWEHSTIKKLFDKIHPQMASFYREASRIWQENAHKQ